MVIEDVFRSPDQKDDPSSGSKKSEGLVPARPMASPVDRLAAFVADLILLVPLMSLMTAPFRRQWEVARLLRDNDGLILAVGGFMGLALLTTVLYQTIFYSVWGATPGKKLLGLRVVSFWTGEKPAPITAFIRSIFWCFETFLFFMPWMGVLSNERRRPWHDRVADTEVIAVDPQRAAGPPEAREVAFVSSLNAATLCCFAALSTVALLRASRPASESSVASRIDERGFLCSSVTEAHDEWLSADGESATRVDVALSLFGADAISDRCLEAEADFALWNGRGGAAAYLAKSLALEDNSDTHLAYALKACEVGAADPACRLARLLVTAPATAPGQHVSNRAPAGRLRPLTVDDVLRTVGPKSPSYLQVYLVRELVDAMRFEEALQLIDRGSPHRRLGYFYASSRSQALWGMHRKSEARVAFKSSLEGLNSSQRTRLARWFCDVESGDACSVNATSSCTLLDRAIQKSPAELEDVGTAVAWIRGQECVGGEKVDYKRLQSKVPGADTQSLLAALERLKDNDRGGARKQLERLFKDIENESPLWYEVQARLVELAESEADLKSISEAWVKSNAGESGWMRVGHRLMARFESLGSAGKVVEVGRRLLEWDRFDKTLQQKLVVVAYNTGDITTAQALMAGLQAAAERTPASDTDFDRISRELASRAAVDVKKESGK